jgi:hypothetical protein
MIISDTSAFVLISPIRIPDKKLVAPQQKIDLYLNGKKQYIDAKIAELNYNTQIVNGIQIVTATSFISGKTSEMIPGLLADCYIHTGSLTPFNFLVRMWERMVN